MQDDFYGSAAYFESRPAAVLLSKLETNQLRAANEETALQ